MTRQARRHSERGSCREQRQLATLEERQRWPEAPAARSRQGSRGEGRRPSRRRPPPPARPPRPPPTATPARRAPASTARNLTARPAPRASPSSAAGPARASIPTTRSPGSTGPPASPTSRARRVFEQKDVEVPDFWSQLATNVVVSKYFRGHLGTPERETSVKQLIDRVVNTIAAWAETQHYFATDEDLAGLQGRADPPDRPPEDGVQLAGLVQRRHRAEAAVLGLLHQLGPGHDVLDHGPRQDRGDALQVRLGRGQQPLPHPLAPSEKMAGGGTASRPRLLHEGLRRLRRRREVGRQDPPRGQDGHPRRRPSGRPRVHRLEGARGAEGLGADRGRATTPASPARPTARVFFQNANHSVRVTDDFMQAVVDDGEWTTHVGRRRQADGHLQGPRRLPPHGRGRPPLRRPGHPVRHDHQRLAHLGQHGPHLREQPVLRVHVPQRHRLQPGLPQPHEVRRRGRRVRRRGLSLRGQADPHGPGDPGRQRQLPDAARSRRTATTSARSGSATPTSARC